jgi:hypothetical protein
MEYSSCYSCIGIWLSVRLCKKKLHLPSFTSCWLVRHLVYVPPQAYGARSLRVRLAHAPMSPWNCVPVTFSHGQPHGESWVNGRTTEDWGRLRGHRLSQPQPVRGVPIDCGWLHSGMCHPSGRIPEILMAASRQYFSRYNRQKYTEQGLCKIFIEVPAEVRLRRQG